MSNQSYTVEDAAEDERTDEACHLDDIEDGCGCTEVWEHMSEQRE